MLRIPKQDRMPAVLAVMAMLVLSAWPAGAAPDAAYRSPSVLAASPDGGTLYVTEYTGGAIAVWNIETRSVARRIALPQCPTGLVVSAEGTQLYATAGSERGALYAVALPSGELAWELPIGHTPMAPALDAEGKTLYVCNRFDDQVAVVDLASKAVTKRIAVERQPVAAVLSNDGARLFVANHLPGGPADADYVSAGISVIDTASGDVAKRLTLPNGSTGLRDICLAPDGSFAYATHILARYQLPTTQLERGWMNTNALTIIDANAAEYVNTVLLDTVDLGAANPWGVDCTADGARICVASAGSHELSIIDRAAMHDKLAKAAAGELVSEVSQSAEDVPNDLAFLVGIRHRVKLEGLGPRGVACVGDMAYFTEYFSDSIGVMNAAGDEYTKPATCPLGAETTLTEERRGELFFNDARLCFQQWQSCASCHPDGRNDALNWDLLNDGMGNPKNTKSMLYSHATPPVMVSGVRDQAETAVRAGIRYIQFAVRPEEDANAIDAYLKSLRPVPSPALVDGEPSEAAKRGAEVFERAACATCHSGKYFTNLQKYNVGTGKGREADWEFDTPTLVELWRTGPYLHDGRAPTIESVLTEFNPDDQHGTTSGLNPEELSDLAAYLKSL